MFSVFCFVFFRFVAIDAIMHMKDVQRLEMQKMENTPHLTSIKKRMLNRTEFFSNIWNAQMTWYANLSAKYISRCFGKQLILLHVYRINSMLNGDVDLCNSIQLFQWCARCHDCDCEHRFILVHQIQWPYYIWIRNVFSFFVSWSCCCCCYLFGLVCFE